MKSSRKISILSLLALTLIFSSCKEQPSVMPIKKNIEDAVFASGHVEQEYNYTVSAKAEGIILSFPAKEGNPVAKHDLVAIIENEIQHNNLQDALVVYQDAVDKASPDAPQLQHLQAQLQQAEQQLAFDQDNFLRYKNLWEKNSVARLDFEKVELQYHSSQNNLLALQKNYQEVAQNLQLSVERNQVKVNTQRKLLQDYKIYTEEAGQVIKTFKKAGELVRKGEAIAKIGSGPYLIKLFVAEDDITKIEIGHAVAIQINTYPHRTFTAKVSKIHPGFDEVEQSYIVEARFETLPEKMFSGTQLQANIETGTRKSVLVIPTDYVSRGSYILNQAGEEKQIVTGSKNSNWTEVISGISEDDILLKPMN